MSTEYEYRGRDRRGVTRSGQTTESPAEFARKHYERGWKELEIRSITTGELVAGIDYGKLSARRGWWTKAEETDASDGA